MPRELSMKPVFVHVSKNAGTSIQRAAGDGITQAGHRTAASWVAEHGRGAPIFAVVRNPFDRVLSEYCFRRRRYEAGEKNPHLANLDKPFDAWVSSTLRDGEFRSRAFFDASGVGYEPGNMVGDTLIWFLPQTRWLCGDSGETLVDEILRYESLEADWRRFSQKYGIAGSLAHHNRSRGDRDYRSAYSAASREAVRGYYREDLEAFGYGFDGAEPRR